MAMGRMWASEVLLLLLLGSSRAVTPGLDVSTAPGLDGSIPPGLDGSVSPGLDGSASPGLDGSVSPGLDGSVSPGLDGSASPGLDGSTPAGRDGTITPKLEGTITPKQDGSISPSWPWRWPITYLDAILAAVRLLNQRISGPCILRLREAQPRPGWVSVGVLDPKAGGWLGGSVGPRVSSRPFGSCSLAGWDPAASAGGELPCGGWPVPTWGRL